MTARLRWRGVLRCLGVAQRAIRDDARTVASRPDLRWRRNWTLRDARYVADMRPRRVKR